MITTFWAMSERKHFLQQAFPYPAGRTDNPRKHSPHFGSNRISILENIAELEGTPCTRSKHHVQLTNSPPQTRRRQKLMQSSSPTPIANCSPQTDSLSADDGCLHFSTRSRKRARSKQINKSNSKMSSDKAETCRGSENIFDFDLLICWTALSYY